MVVHDVSCREVVERVTDFLVGRLTVDRRDLFERHIAMCTWCQTYLDQMRHTLRVVGSLREDDVPAPLVDSLALAFTAEQSGKSTPEPRFGSSRPRGRRPPWRSSRRRPPTPTCGHQRSWRTSLA